MIRTLGKYALRILYFSLKTTSLRILNQAHSLVKIICYLKQLHRVSKLLHTRLSMTLLIFTCPSWRGQGHVGGALSSATFISSLQWASRAFQLLSVLSKYRWCREQRESKARKREIGRERVREKTRNFKENVFFQSLSLSLQLPKGSVRDLCQALCVALSPRFVLGISLPCCWFGSSPFLSHSYTFPAHTHTHRHNSPPWTGACASYTLVLVRARVEPLAGTDICFICEQIYIYIYTHTCRYLYNCHWQST